ncbi:MAG: 16S rRNA (uracil(1498)-N(3))-methyltransferase [Bacteroidales bacterium]|nr:16S rRNA (uracil(1498)-N(3))-methyltransferase [Bacteroidales bacterium]
MQLFYAKELKSDIYTLPEDESRHVVKVLRLGAGDSVFLTDGQGTLLRAAIVQPDVRGCVVKVEERNVQPEPTFQLRIAVAPTKNESRIEMFAEKATEAGIAAITPIRCDHSERTILRTDRLEKIVVSAMKQSLRLIKPRVDSLVRLDDVIISATEPQRFICHCEGAERVSLQQAMRPGVSTLILIGPEGDFSPREVALALEYGFRPITLGNSRLRTETAALAATFYSYFINQPLQ